MIELLDQGLPGALDLGLQAKQAHWDVKGASFIALHEVFDKVADELEEFIDDADTADLFTEVSRGLDKLLWLVEAHAQERDWHIVSIGLRRALTRRSAQVSRWMPPGMA